MTQAADREIGPGEFWKAIGSRAVGASVVTARDTQGPAGFLGLSATHLSASPPMLMVSVGSATSALGTIRNAGHFAINYLSAADRDLIDVFGGKTERKGADRFDPGRWCTLTSGAPVLKNALGVLDCRLEELIERHGSVIAIGRLTEFSIGSSSKPAVMYRGAVTTVMSG
ncbi:flavin reductase family protein [Neorhizobium petrolearium]|uniref:flavin reductase family protein n=1 Tax=Neorhizobium petrolearium TaxID=515361 RepID=UPI003F13530E